MQKSIVPYLIYPLLLIFGYSFYFYFNRIMPYSLLSAVLSIGLFSTMFLIYEYLFPKYDEWKWNLREIAEDLIYYNLCVQVLIPLGLIFLYQKCLNYYFLDLWPNHLPTFIQLVILSLTGEFLFYFWHRFSHESSFFRGIHLVHHLPTKLYSLNTVRFHFLDKFIECHLTVILFIFLGAQLELIYLYYIFFTATGLVQHCNTEVKFGIFDYVFASAETHRLHHDSIEENTRINYANNLVLWDLIFNTFKRIQSSPKLIGVKKFYPNGVLFETLFPFKMIYNQLEKSIIKVKMEKQKIDSLKPFLEKISNFKSIQENLLLSIINKNAKTLYGKKYQFENILSIKDFKKNVPLIEYEKIRDEMDQVISGKSNVLTKSQVIYFNKTSGTLGKPKYLPVTQEVLEDYKRIQKIISSCAYEYCPDGFNGLIFSVVGKAHEEKLNEQFYAGAMSGKTNSLTPTIVKKRYAITDEILNIEPLEKRNLYLAAIALL